jgi:hypothetical protein
MKSFVLLFLLLSCAAAFSQKKATAVKDPWAGAYNLDLSKSKFTGTAPREETITVASATKASIKYTISGKNLEGNAYTISYDGKVGIESPELLEGKPIAQITYQMPSPREFTSQGHAGDGSTSTGTITLSKDGKTITVHQHDKDVQGVQHDQTFIYVRQ